MNFKYIVLIAYLICSCNSNPEKQSTVSEVVEQKDIYIDPVGNRLCTRFLPPKGFERQDLDKHTFGHYLRNLLLKPHGSKVLYYNGKEKDSPGVYLAVVDQEIGEKNLHQCADAVIRLKAEYHWDQKEFDKIHFNFTNGFNVDYTEWIKGRRIVVKGNKTYWDNGDQFSNTYSDFWDYMELIFTYAGTASLSNELISVKFADMEIGDVLIVGGHPGHAVIVVDMIEHIKTGKKLFLLAQSYMPAQQLQILANPNGAYSNPWYALEVSDELDTPEWKFNTTDLKRWKED